MLEENGPTADYRVVQSYMNYLLQAKDMDEKTQGDFIVYFDKGPLAGNFDILDPWGSWHGVNSARATFSGEGNATVDVGGSEMDTRSFDDPIEAAKKWDSITDSSFDLPDRMEMGKAGLRTARPAATAEEGEAARQRPRQARKIFDTFHGVMGTFTTTFHGLVASPHGFYKANEKDIYENFGLKGHNWEESIGQFVFASPEEVKKLAKSGGARMNKNKRKRKKRTRKKRTRKKRTRKKRTRNKRTRKRK